MLSYMLRPLRQLADVFLANDSPRQIALGITLGMVLGMVPKGNLIAAAMLVAILAFRVNRSAGLMSAALFSGVSLMLDGFSHRLGLKLLEVPGMQPTYAALYDMPLGPWIGFNNTVVLGSLMLGIYGAYPCYVVSRWTVARFQPPIARWLLRYKVARTLLGVDLSSRLGMSHLVGGNS